MSAAPDGQVLTYAVRARLGGPGGAAEIQAKQASISFDAAPQVGDELPGPAELLCAAFAACMLKNVERFSQLLSFTHHGATLTVTAERQQQPPMFTKIQYELQLATDESPQRIALLQRNLAKHGTVYNTLAQVCVIDGQVTPTASGPDAA